MRRAGLRTQRDVAFILYNALYYYIIIYVCIIGSLKELVYVLLAVPRGLAGVYLKENVFTKMLYSLKSSSVNVLSNTKRISQVERNNSDLQRPFLFCESYDLVLKLFKLSIIY